MSIVSRVTYKYSHDNESYNKSFSDINSLNDICFLVYHSYTTESYPVTCIRDGSTSHFQFRYYRNRTGLLWRRHNYMSTGCVIHNESCLLGRLNWQLDCRFSSANHISDTGANTNEHTAANNC